MTVQLNLDFSKETLSKTVLDILRNGLKDEPKSKLSFEECLIRVSQGKKLEYGAANYLLSGLIKTLYMEDSPQGDEYPPGERAEDIGLGKDLSMSQNLAVARSPEQEDGTSDTSPQTGNPTQSTSTAPHPPLVDVRPKGKATKVPGADTKKKEICRFYNRGHCTKKKDCRFDHPAVCQKFHNFGSLSSNPKGCNGKCNAFHPNACRSSLRNKTCSWDECRFYHLKGTKRTNSAPENSANQNWRANNQNRSGSNFESKNGFACLNTRDQNPRKKATPAQGANPKTKPDLVTSQEKIQLGQTLEAIMNRLSVMESRLTTYPHQVQHPQQHQQLSHPIQPLLSPAVPHPSTQTQFQWASQPQWTQSQTQPQY